MQKKLTLIILSFFVLNGVLQAQFKKGDKMAGATIASGFFNSGKSDISFSSVTGYSSDNNNYGISINPTLGWFVSDKTVVGASVNINPTGQKATYHSAGTTFEQDKTNSFNIGIGGFVRNYFTSGKSFMPYGQFGFNLGISNASDNGFHYYSAPLSKVSYDGKSSGGFFANALLQVGFTKMVGDYTGLDFFAGYTYSYSKNTFKTTTITDLGNDGSIDTTAENDPTTKYTSNGFTVGVGFQVFLAGKKK